MSIWRVSYTSEQVGGGETRERVVVASDAGTAFVKIQAIDSTASAANIQLIADNEVT